MISSIVKSVRLHNVSSSFNKSKVTFFANFFFFCQQILAEVETGIQRLPENKANLIRNQTINILNQKQKMQSNLTSSEIKTLNNLTKNVEIRICKANKGNSTVNLDKN